jgi:hypothetical protein
MTTRTKTIWLVLSVSQLMFWSGSAFASIMMCDSRELSFDQADAESIPYEKQTVPVNGELRNERIVADTTNSNGSSMSGGARTSGGTMMTAAMLDNLLQLSLGPGKRFICELILVRPDPPGLFMLDPPRKSEVVLVS